MAHDFKKGEIVYYPKDYSNARRGEDISGEEFKELIESNFPEMQVILEKTTGWGQKEYLFAPSVKDRNKPRRDVIINKGYVCLKEPTKEETGLLIGIHDFVNTTYIIDKKEI